MLRRKWMRLSMIRNFGKVHHPRTSAKFFCRPELFKVSVSPLPPADSNSAATAQAAGPRETHPGPP
jgi:hypothetical protein